MLSALFSFRGRVNRLQYLGWAIVSILVMLIPALILGFLMSMVMAASMHGMPAMQMIHSPQFIACMVVPMLLFIWPAFALLVKRLRDIGLPPVISILVYWGFILFDRFVIASFLHAPFGNSTFIGIVVETIASLFVLFMPGRGDDGGGQSDMAHIDLEIERMRKQTQSEYLAPTSRAPQSGIRATVSQPAPAGPPVFGRRR